MSEYRHIANLRGPQGASGADATEIPGASYGSPIPLTSDDDLDALEPGVYRVDFNSVAAALGTPGERVGSVEVLEATASQRAQRFTTNSASPGHEIWTRATASGEWSEWREISAGSGVVTLSSSDDLDELEPGEYQVDFTSTSEDLGLPGGRVGHVNVIKITASQRVQRFTTGHTRDDVTGQSLQVWTRAKGPGDADYSGWWMEYPEDTSILGHKSISARIKDLARRDGWLAVYDPTDLSTTTINGFGRVEQIRDGLGNLPALTSEAGEHPAWLPGEYGQLAGMQGGTDTTARFLSAAFDEPLSQPTTMMFLARNNATHASQRFVLDGTYSSGRNAIFTHTWTGNPWVFFVGDGNYGAGESDTNPHVITGAFDGPRSALFIDGQVSRYGAGENSTVGARGVTLGSRWDQENGHNWLGSFGLLLIHDGSVDAEAMNRMQNLIHSATGIPQAAPTFSPETRAYSESGQGKTTVAHGSPDAASRAGIASLTKLMTTRVARQWLDTDAALDAETTAREEDLQGSRFQAGDVISYRDLFYAAALPSDNAAPNIIANGVGQMMLDQDGETYEGQTPRQRFIEEMNAEAGRLGYEGVAFTSTVGSGVMSPRQIADLMRRTAADSTLREIYGTLEATIEVTAGPEPRTIDIEHTLSSSTSIPFPEMVAAKTGTFDGYGHLAIVWDHPDGSEHVSVITDTDASDSSRRYAEMRKVIGTVISGIDATGTFPDDPPSLERFTGNREITHLVNGGEPDASFGAVRVSRTGNTVTVYVSAMRFPENFSQGGLIPEGFRPSHIVDGVILSGTDVLRAYVNSGGTFSISGNSENDRVQGSLTYQINDRTWPSTPYPGR